MKRAMIRLYRSLTMYFIRGPCVGDVAKLLDNVVERLVVLKRKSDVSKSFITVKCTNPWDLGASLNLALIFQESICDELDAAKICKKRVDHLKDYANPQVKLFLKGRSSTFMHFFGILQLYIRLPRHPCYELHNFTVTAYTFSVYVKRSRKHL